MKMAMIFNKKMNVHLCDFLKVIRVFVCISVLFFASEISVQSETYYRYVDENGTVVITQGLEDVPEDQRKYVKEVRFPKQVEVESAGKAATENKVGQKQKTALKEIVDAEKIKAVGEEAARQGKVLFSSFIEDQKMLLVVYTVAGIVGFFLFSKLLKRFVGSSASKIVMKIAVAVAIFSGVYLVYLSWLNKSVLNFNQPEDLSAQTLADRITTPKEILQQTQRVVDQFNKNTRQRETILNGMDGS